MPLQLHISTEQKVIVRLVPTTPGGKPAQVDGVPTWEMQEGGDPDVVLTASEDGLSCEMVSGTAPSQNVINVSADADMGTGVTHITDTISLAITDPMAKNLGLVADEPVLKGEPSASTFTPATKKPNK